MDFSKLNPWRKTPTLYIWDDNWRPVVAQFSPSPTPKQWHWICPDTYYALLQNFNFLWLRNPGIGSVQFTLTTFRGNAITYYSPTQQNSQAENNTRISFHPEIYITSAALIAQFNYPIPYQLSFIPGDRLSISWTGIYTNTRLGDSFINLNAYYF